MTKAVDQKQRNARFLSAITHDLAQPLHAARLFASALEGKIPDPRQQQMVDNIHASLETAEQMLQEISLVGKLDARKLPVVIEPVAIQKVVYDVLSECSQLAKERGIELKFVASKVVVQSDKIMLTRALQRLVSNALRFTEKGKVMVGIRRKKDHCLLEVWDKGIGVYKVNLENIFEDFYRAQNHDLYNERCFGLGLGVVKRICDQIGSEISVRSWPDKGSVFSLKLPLVNDAKVD